MSSSNTKRKRGAKEDKNLQQDKKRLCLPPKLLGLSDLPVIPLHLIFAQLKAKSRQMLCDAIPKLKPVYVDYVMHNYNAALHYHANMEIRWCIKTHTILKVVNEATAFFVNAGHADSWASTMHHLLIKPTDQFDTRHMDRFLNEFYRKLELEASVGKWPYNLAGRRRLHHLRLLQMVTLLNLFRQFRQFRRVTSRTDLLHWKLDLHLKQVGIVPIFQEESNSKDQEHFIQLIRALAQLLTYDMDQYTQHRDFGSFSCSITDSPQSISYTHLKFTILAPIEIVNLLKDVPAGKVDTSTVLSCPTLDAFSIYLDLKSAGVNGFKGKCQLCVLPLF